MFTWDQVTFKINESRYIALFAVTGCLKKLFSIDWVNIYFSQSVVSANIYLFSIFFPIDFEKYGFTQHCLNHDSFIIFKGKLR